MSHLLLPAIAFACFTAPQDDAATDKAPPVTLTYEAKAGQTVTATYSISEAFELISSEAIQNGEEIPAEAMPQMERSNSKSLEVEFTDTITEAEGGAASVFTRTFEGIAGEFAMDMSMEGGPEMGGFEPQSMSGELESPLDGESVVCTLEGDDFMIEPSEDSSLEEDDVTDLRADMSLAFLLPDGEVEQGASWDVKPEELDRLRNLAGDVRADGGDDESMMMDMGQMGSDDDDEDEPELSGTIKMTYAGMRKVDGRSLVVLKMEVNVTESRAFSPDLGEDMEEEPQEGMIVPDEIEIEITETVKGDGELLWDPVLNQAAQLDIELEVEKITGNSMSFDIPQMGPMEMEQSETEEGTISIHFEKSVK